MNGEAEEKWFPLILSGELGLASHAGITVVLFSNISAKAVGHSACWEINEIPPFFILP